MKAFIIILTIAFFSVASAISLQSKSGDYFWRDYDGKIPLDALKVAQNGSDESVYVGQGYYHCVGLLPGMIKAGVMNLSVAALGRIYSTENNIKILATNSANLQRDFQWISVDYDNFERLRSLPFLDLVKGGTETNSTVYIGRYSDPQYTNIGKIYTIAPYQGLAIPNEQGIFTIYKNFEVLVKLKFNNYGGLQRSDSEESKDDSI